MPFIDRWDIAVFHFVNKSLASGFLDGPMAVVTEAGDHPWVFVFPWLALMIFGGKRVRQVGWLVIPLLILSDFIPGKILKPLFERPRPFLALPDVRLLIPVTTDISPFGFPSNHASNMAALATLFSMAFPKKEVIIPGFFIAALVGFSRVYVGVHFPLDVAVGAAYGAMAGVVVFNLWEMANNREGLPADAGKKKEIKPESRSGGRPRKSG